jgi:cobalt-zinc-cadmium efflux system outer membrane protein
MTRRWLIVISGLMFSLTGCLYNVRERADQEVCSLSTKPYDQLPETSAESKSKKPDPSPAGYKKSDAVQLSPIDVQTTALTTVDDDPAQVSGAEQQPERNRKPRLEPQIPEAIPGSETPRLPGKASPEQLQKIYPKLPPLPEAPVPQPGPDGKPLTLSGLQKIAATNSATLHEAAYAVQAAYGNWIQARAYPNPNIGWNVTPSNDGSTAGAQGPFIDQKIIGGGKLKLAGAGAEMDLRNAELALRRARSDLATQVRNAYFAVLVAKESLRVNKALAQFTDQIYVVQASGLLPGAVSAPYEPAALQAQAFSARLAYKQSIQAYITAWQQLVAAIGLRHLPLSEVAGRVDAVIPYYDYDAVRAHVLINHTDVLTARNGIEKARYLLKLAQVTPVPDVDFNVALLKEYSLLPKQFVHTATITVPFPIWDRNRGGIMAAESALGSALEEPHRVEENLTTTLATAYMGYKQNLDALEYYRKYILPNQVIYYRGVYDHYQIVLGSSFGDLVTAQQTLAADVSNYLGILSSLWTSVVAVADLLQTDDLFQMAKPHAVPSLPDLDSLQAWPCCHDCPPAGEAGTGPSCSTDCSKGVNLKRWHNPEDKESKTVDVASPKDMKSTSLIQPVAASVPAAAPFAKASGPIPSIPTKPAEGLPASDKAWKLPRRLPMEDRLLGNGGAPTLEEPPPVPKVPKQSSAEDKNQN